MGDAKFKNGVCARCRGRARWSPQIRYCQPCCNELRNDPARRCLDCPASLTGTRLTRHRCLICAHLHKLKSKANPRCVWCRKTGHTFKTCSLFAWLREYAAEAVKDLPRAQREIVQMVLDGSRPVEVARHRRCTKATVCIAMQRARANLARAALAVAVEMKKSH